MRLKTIRWKRYPEYADSAVAYLILRHKGASYWEDISFVGEDRTPMSVWHIKWPP